MVFFCEKCNKCFAGEYTDWFKHADNHKSKEDGLTDLELTIKEFLLEIGDPLDWLDGDDNTERYKNMTKDELIKEIEEFKKSYLFDDEFEKPYLSRFKRLFNRFKKYLEDKDYIWIDDYENVCEECESWCECEITPHPPDEDDCV